MNIIIQRYLREKGMGMKRLAFQQIASKWLKTYIMQQDEKLAPYLPQTVWWEPSRLLELCKQHRLIYLKPDKGGGGVGIIRVEQSRSHRYEVWYLTKRQTIFGDKTLISFLRRRMHPRKRYLIQQGIRLARVYGRPFDIRVIVQKPQHRWLVMGMAAKVAAKEKIVTNRSSGGMAMTVPKVLSSGLGWSQEQIRYIEDVLRAIALQTAHTLSRRFTGLRVLGLDIGIDEQGKLWIFEVNTRPMFQLFRQTDPVRYRAIIRNQQHIIRAGRKRRKV